MSTSRISPRLLLLSLLIAQPIGLVKPSSLNSTTLCMSVPMILKPFLIEIPNYRFLISCVITFTQTPPHSSSSNDLFDAHTLARSVELQRKPSQQKSSPLWTENDILKLFSRNTEVFPIIAYT